MPALLIRSEREKWGTPKFAVRANWCRRWTSALVYTRRAWGLWDFQNAAVSPRGIPYPRWRSDCTVVIPVTPVSRILAGRAPVGCAEVISTSLAFSVTFSLRFAATCGAPQKIRVRSGWLATVDERRRWLRSRFGDGTADDSPVARRATVWVWRSGGGTAENCWSPGIVDPPQSSCPERR